MAKRNEASAMEIDDNKSAAVDHINPKFSINGSFFYPLLVFGLIPFQWLFLRILSFILVVGFDFSFAFGCNLQCCSFSNQLRCSMG